LKHLVAVATLDEYGGRGPGNEDTYDARACLDDVIG
jgi:hypothetical protein